MIHQVELSSVGLRRGPGAEDAIDLHGAQTARDYARPARLARGIGVRSQNPLRLRVIGGVENHLERLCGDAIGLAGVDAEGAEVCGDARLHAGERLTSSFIRFRGEKLRETLKQLVNGFTERARLQAAFMALIKAARAGQRLVRWRGECGMLRVDSSAASGEAVSASERTHRVAQA